MFEWYNVVLLLNTTGFECCNFFADFQPVAQNIPERLNHYGQNPLRQFSTTTHLSDHPTSCQHSYSSNYSAANNTSRNSLDISSTISASSIVHASHHKRPRGQDLNHSSQVRFSTKPAYQDFPNQPTLPANRIPPKQPTQPTYQDFPGFISEFSIFNNVHQDPVSVSKQ